MTFIRENLLILQMQDVACVSVLRKVKCNLIFSDAEIVKIPPVPEPQPKIKRKVPPEPNGTGINEYLYFVCTKREYRLFIFDPRDSLITVYSDV